MRVSVIRFLVFVFKKENHIITIVNRDRVDFLIFKIIWAARSLHPRSEVCSCSHITANANSTCVWERTFGSTRFWPFMKFLHVDSSFVGSMHRRMVSEVECVKWPATNLRHHTSPRRWAGDYREGLNFSSFQGVEGDYPEGLKILESTWV